MADEHRKLFISIKGKKGHTCSYCKKPIVILSGKRPGSLTIHHQDENKKNNSIKNLKPFHLSCHTKYHHGDREKRATRHGTTAAYTNDGCRCKRCKKVWAAACLRYKKTGTYSI